MRSGRALAGIAVLTVVVVAVLLGGCRDGGTTEALGWHRLEAPAGARLTALASGAPLLVAGQVGAGQAAEPKVWQVSGATWSPVPVQPATYYGARASLVRVATSGSHLVALGRAVGGAHGNPRFSTWSGTASGMRETAQRFELFGGPRAIGLNDLTSGPAQDVVVGSWAPGTGAAGVAVWIGDGATYRRRDEEPGLRSSASDQTSAAAIAARGTGFVVAGTTTHLGGGRIALHATAFWQASADAPWRRAALASSGDSRAMDVDCSSSDCLVAGVDRGRLALWRLDRDGRTRTVRVDHAPLLDDSATVQVAGGWVAARTAGGPRLWHVHEDAARPVQPPPGPVQALATSGDRLYAVLSGGTLWTATP